jgi:hypothetical protein
LMLKIRSMRILTRLNWRTPAFYGIVDCIRASEEATDSIYVMHHHDRETPRLSAHDAGHFDFFDDHANRDICRSAYGFATGYPQETFGRRTAHNLPVRVTNSASYI